MAVHREVLDAALRICRHRGGWRFRPVEIVRALPDRDAGTVRTHVVSRCCVNAPPNHPHRWDYFERVERGVYEIRRPYRRRGSGRLRTSKPAGPRPDRVAERAAAYRATPEIPRDTIHVMVTRSGGWYVADCHEVAVITQGRTLDELIANLREAVDLHLEGEDAAQLGLVASPRLSVTYELASRTS